MRTKPVTRALTAIAATHARTQLRAAGIPPPRDPLAALAGYRVRAATHHPWGLRFAYPLGLPP
jgi:hypothetical protein